MTFLKEEQLPHPNTQSNGVITGEIITPSPFSGSSPFAALSAVRNVAVRGCHGYLLASVCAITDDIYCKYCPLPVHMCVRPYTLCYELNFRSGLQRELSVKFPPKSQENVL